MNYSGFRQAMRSPQVIETSENYHSTHPTPKNYSDFCRLCKMQAKNYVSDREHLVLFIDADNLKQVNDTLGHSVGDEFIELIWKVLFRTCPNRAVPFRAGGDEFVVYCSFDRVQEITTFATRIYTELNKIQKVGSHDLLLSCSLGASHSNSKNLDLLRLIEEADTALLWAKRNGKRQLKYYNFEECNYVKLEQQYTADLAPALDKSEIKVFFQPLYNIEDRSVEGAEALIRWNHSSGIDVPAKKIVSAAARAGKLGELGKYVLKKACNAAVYWPVEVFVSVNLTASDFRREDLHETVMSTLEGSNLAKTRLRIEITEIECLEVTQTVLANIEKLQLSGIKIGVDDFGTGYSSMGSIDKFPVDFIKIDRSLIENCNTRISSKIFLRAIQLISQNTGVQIIAEGIETLGELAVVRSIGIPIGQGYYYSKAIPEDRFLCLLGAKFKLSDNPAA